MIPRHFHVYGVLALLLLCGGCAQLPKVGQNYVPPVAQLPAQWHTPVSEEAQTSATEIKADTHPDQALRHWWQQLNDPLLVKLIDEAHMRSATLAQAALRISQAQANLAEYRYSGLTDVTASASRSRNAFTFGGPASVRTQDQLQLSTAWEIDLFGRIYRATQSAEAKLVSTEQQWHDARISVAAEVANAYVTRRFCEQQLMLAQSLAQSQQHTAQAVTLAGQVGLQSPATVALNQVNVFDRQNQIVQQQAICDSAVHALVALSGMDTNTLIQQLKVNEGYLPAPRQFKVDSLPAAVLNQRPDVIAAERDVATASANIGVAEAVRYPRLSLNGNIGRSRFDSNGAVISTNTWSIGPSVQLPIWTARAAADFESAKVAYESAVTTYHAKVRQAVREVEDALVQLNSIANRRQDTQTIAYRYESLYQAATTRQAVGLGEGMDVENARRLMLQAQATLVQMQRDHLIAWINLYRAVGGGWSDMAAETHALETHPSQLRQP